MKLVVLGLSLSSSWGNGHATTFRALLAAFAARGHDVTFLERDVPWYAGQRDLTDPAWCRLAFYQDVADLKRWAGEVASADAVIVGSYVPDGVSVGSWVQRTATGVTAFYDIDTPVTLAKLARGDHEYLSPALIPGYDVYLSFTGGPPLGHLEEQYGSPAARAPEKRFVVAGPQYPPTIAWPANVERIEHLPPVDHAGFYSASRWTLNVTRADMIAAGWSPSVRLFEAAACATPIVSDVWEGLGELLAPGREIVLARTGGDVVAALDRPDAAAIGAAAQARILAEHTAAHRAAELERHLDEARAAQALTDAA